MARTLIPMSSTDVWFRTAMNSYLTEVHRKFVVLDRQAYPAAYVTKRPLRALLRVLHCVYKWRFSLSGTKQKTGPTSSNTGLPSRQRNLPSNPYLVSFPERNVEGEERWQSLGSAGGIVILTVAYTIRDRDGDEVIRIISARKASPSERKRYAN